MICILAVKRICVSPAPKEVLFKLYSQSLSVKIQLKESEVFAPWSVKCLLCKKPESVEYPFINRWDAVPLRGVLQSIAKKDIFISTSLISFLFVRIEAILPYYMLMVLGLSVI